MKLFDRYQLKDAGRQAETRAMPYLLRGGECLGEALERSISGPG